MTTASCVFSDPAAVCPRLSTHSRTHMELGGTLDARSLLHSLVEGDHLRVHPTLGSPACTEPGPSQTHENSLGGRGHRPDRPWRSSKEVPRGPGCWAVVSEDRGRGEPHRWGRALLQHRGPLSPAPWRRGWQPEGGVVHTAGPVLAAEAPRPLCVCPGDPRVLWPTPGNQSPSMVGREPPQHPTCWGAALGAAHFKGSLMVSDLM